MRSPTQAVAKVTQFWISTFSPSQTPVFFVFKSLVEHCCQNVGNLLSKQ
jgi:hypothetical protein